MINSRIRGIQSLWIFPVNNVDHTTRRHCQIYRAIRNLAQVNAECNQLNDDKNANLQKMEGLRRDFTRESNAMKAEIQLKDNIINDYECDHSCT